MHDTFNYPTFNAEGLKKTVIASIIIHAVVILLAFTLSSGDKRRVFITPVFTVEMVESKKKSVKKQRPAIAAKPQVKKKPPVKAPPVKVKEPLQKESIRLPQDDSTIDESLSRIRERLKEREEEARLSSSIERIREKLEAPTESESATAVDEDTGRSGRVTKELFDLKAREYYAEIEERIHESWIYPGDKSGKLEAIYSIKIGTSGELIDLWKEKGSGNTLFDESGLRAIKKSAPFPSLPDELLPGPFEVGVRFCPLCDK